MRPVIRFLRLPVDDYLAALELFIRRFRWPHLAALAAAAVFSWWIYVPIHELLHAAGCRLGGGSVTRLEIDPIYGAALLQPFFPWVAVGSEYAGQLTGFDTGGSDLTYLLTDFLPFVLTIIIGVPLLRAAGGWRGTGLTQALLFGAALPVALAPFVSLTGDFYEMGSILVSRLVARGDPGFAVDRWRSDDVFKLIGELFGAGGSGGLADAAGIAASLLLGSMLAFATYAAGTLWPWARRRPPRASG
ncbi:MAG: hypothetical protein ACRERC_21810 [Candidatus Binatia bacterium]